MPSERRDLNLLRVFASIMEHRNLAMAGRELGLTASAISHALGRLRLMMADELFVPRKRTMQPTPRALELAPKIATVLGDVAELLSDGAFVPERCERAFNIGASDYSTTCLLAPLVERLQRKAPGIRLRVMPIGRIDLVEQLDVAALDAVVSWFGAMPGRIRRAQLTTEAEALVARRGHPLASGTPTLARLLSFPHLVVEFIGAEEVAADGFLLERGLYRRVWQERLLLDNTPADQLAKLATVTIPTFAPVPAMLADTDLVATLPSRLARSMAARAELVLLELPYEPKTVTIEAIWHARGDRDRALQWLLSELSASLA